MFGFDIGATLAIVGAGILAGLGFLWKMFRDQRKAGRDSVLVEQARKNDALRKEFERIDNAAPDLDDSLDSLSNRAKRKRKPASK